MCEFGKWLKSCFKSSSVLWLGSDLELLSGTTDTTNRHNFIVIYLASSSVPGSLWWKDLPVTLGNCLSLSEHARCQRVPSVVSVITAVAGAISSKPPASTGNADLLWRAGNSVHVYECCRLLIAVHRTGSCRGSCTHAVTLLCSLFVSNTQTRRHCQTSCFSTEDAISPTKGDFIALDCRQGNLWGSRTQPFLSLSTLRSRRAIEHGLINFSSNTEFFPFMFMLVLQLYLLSYDTSIFFIKICKEFQKRNTYKRHKLLVTHTRESSFSEGKGASEMSYNQIIKRVVTDTEREWFKDI